jgi:hypothetical protein
MSTVRRFVLTLLAVASFPAAANFHLMSIREVYVGPAADANAQYVELQAYAAGQNEVAGHSLSFFGPTGTLLGTVTFPADVPNDDDQAYILVATTNAETRFGITADLRMPARLDPAGGKVCFADVDCFSWGNYTGAVATPSPSGNPFNAAGGLTPDSAVRRDISGGSSTTKLDANDDTDNSAADFVLAGAPDPHSNGPGADPGGCGAYGCGGGYGSGSLSLASSLVMLLALSGRRRLPK